MAVLKRQRADGKWEFVQNIGRKVLTEEDIERIENDLSFHEKNNDVHITAQERSEWNNKQDALNTNQIRPIYVQASKPNSPTENDIWIEVE